jgi:hypothetical protein
MKVFVVVAMTLMTVAVGNVAIMMMMTVMKVAMRVISVGVEVYDVRKGSSVSSMVVSF